MQQLPTFNDRLFNGNPWLFNLNSHFVTRFVCQYYVPLQSESKSG
jgi:hypothetical protein